jgi:hypothetical protein
MFEREIASLAAVVVAFTASADACTPIRYDMSGVSAEAFAREMVAEAHGIEVMRVVSRTAEPPDRPYNIYATSYGQVYLYRFETVRVLNGRRGRVLELHGLDEHWLRQRLPETPEINREPLWWLSERGYLALQHTAIPDPHDSGSIACAVPTTFVIGEQYLVFRGRSGAILAPGFDGRGSFREPQRPVVERVTGPSDPWLREVEAAVALNPKQGTNLWQSVFELVFGRASDPSPQSRGRL